MAGRDAGSKMVGGQSIVPASHTTTQTGAFIDTQGYLAALVEISVGAVSTLDSGDNFAVTVTFSDVAAGTSPTTIASTQLTNPVQASWSTAVPTYTVWAYALNASGNADCVFTFGVDLTGIPHRYMNVVATATGSPSATFGANVLLGSPIVQPAAITANNKTA